jgi:hypothetical protein
MFETLTFLESVAAKDPGPLAKALAQSDRADRREAAATEREAEARRMAGLERAEALALADRQLGGPLAEIRRSQMLMAEAADEIAELQAKLEKAIRKRDSARQNAEFCATRMQAATDCATRSATVTGGPDLLAPAKQAHREYVQASRAAWKQAQTGVAPRPFARRGVAARSEYCVHCAEQGVDDQTSYLLHSDPELNVPVTPPGMQAEADRRQAEADRLTELGYSAETARLAAEPFGERMAVR